MMNPLRLARSIAVKLTALALIALPVILAGCNVKSGGFIISLPVHVRVFNALVDGGQVTVTVGDQTVSNGLPFEGLTTYQDVNSGNQEIKITVGGGASTIVDTTTLLIDDSKYTYMIYGTSAAPTAQLVPDAAAKPSSGQFLLIVPNAAFGTSGFDIYVTAPGVPLAFEYATSA